MIDTPAAAPSWLTVVGSVYYQSGSAAVVAAETRSQRVLAGGEQPWQRSFSAGPDWQPLPCGWLEGGAALLVLANEPPQWRVVPTAEERAAARALVVELALLPPGGGAPLPFALVRPGEDCRFEPASLRLAARCPAGAARVTLTLLPL